NQFATTKVVFGVEDDTPFTWSDTQVHVYGGIGDDSIQGSSQADYLQGDAGIDILEGGGGEDTLRGGADNDQLEGGDAVDTLEGGSGDDTLTGGLGTDSLIGGTGYDTYHAEEGDTINDSDGKGTVYLNDKQLSFATRKKGETTWKDSAGNTYALTNGTLSINDPLIIEGFDNGELGIYLDDEEDPSDPNGSPRPPGYNPGNASLIPRRDPLVLDLDGNGQIDAVASSASSVYFDFNGDGIAERSGWLAAQDGFLALDANSNGAIDGLSELFGSATQDGFTELAGHDGNADGRIDDQDVDYTRLRVWQDANQDAIVQSGELNTLADIGITRIELATTAADTLIGDNRLAATGSFTMNGEQRLAADIELAVNFALTDSNPNRPLGLPPQLDPAVFDLPWLRGYGNVKSLPMAYQESPALRQAASTLADSGWLASLRNFTGFMTQWSGLQAAHQAHGVTRTNLTPEDKAWMLENLTGQDVQKSAIETANFGAITPGAGRVWNTAYLDTAWNSFVQREALSFAVQAGSRAWLRGASYSLNRDRYIVTDAQALQASLLAHLNAVSDKEDAAFAVVAISSLKRDGVTLDAAALKQGLTTTTYRSLFDAVLDDASGNIHGQTATGAFVIDTGNGIVALGMSGNDVLNGGTGNDILDGGAGNDTLYGNTGDDTYVFGSGYGQDTVYDYGSTVGAGDTVRIGADVTPADVTVTRDQYNLYLSLNGGADRMTLSNWFSGNDYWIEAVRFADGTAWDASELEQRIQVVSGTAGNDDAARYMRKIDSRRWRDGNRRLPMRASEVERRAA
ncbi:MAG: calcium-binding protein, partial [Rhodocyclaceae bacterium]